MYIEALGHRIGTIDWTGAKKEAARFIQPKEQESIDLWSRELFLDPLNRPRERLAGGSG